MGDYSIKFEKSKEYQRFALSGLLVEVNKYGDVVIDFYEDIEQSPDMIVYHDDEEHPSVISPEYDYIRMIYASGTLPINKVQFLINALQNKLDAYNHYVRTIQEGNNNE